MRTFIDTSLDAGSTTYYMIEFLKGKNVHVVTNGIFNIVKLAENKISVYMLDGNVDLNCMATQGEKTLEKLKKFNFNKAFPGSKGIHNEIGFTTPDPFDGLLKATVIACSDASYVLADSSKLGIKSLYTYAPLTDAVIITENQKGFTWPDARFHLAETVSKWTC